LANAPEVPIRETKGRMMAMRDVPIEDPNQKALLNQMIITSHLVRQMAEKDAYLNSLKEQRAEALAEIERLKQQISELAGNQTGSVA
jgi:hypothetical protein